MKPHAKSNCRVNASWVPVLVQGEFFHQPFIDFFLYNAKSATPKVVWDTLKAFLRGLLIQAISRLKKMWNRRPF